MTTNTYIMNELKKKMQHAAFCAAVEQHTSSIELLITLGAAANNLSQDVLTIILATITGKLIMQCDDADTRQIYADHIKEIIDMAMAISKEC